MSRSSAVLVVFAVAGCGGLISAAPSRDKTDEPPRAETIAAPYRLVFELPSRTWRAGEPITGEARLELAEGAGREISGSGGGVIAFEYAQVDGPRRVVPIWTASCASYEVGRDRPIRTGLTKSGAIDDGDPDADFYRDFLMSPSIHLPQGEWEISAVTWFHEGAECTGAERRPRATITITVEP